MTSRDSRFFATTTQDSENLFEKFTYKVTLKLPFTYLPCLYSLCTAIPTTIIMAANSNFNTPIIREDDNSCIIQGSIPILAPVSQEILDSVGGSPPAARVEKRLLARVESPAQTNNMAEQPPCLVALPDGRLIRPAPGLPTPKSMFPSAQQPAAAGNPKIYVPGPPPFSGERPSTSNDLQLITSMERFTIKCSPQTGANDVDLAEIATSWLQYLEELQAHLAHPRCSRGPSFDDHVRGLVWVVYRLNETIERSANPRYARTAFSIREFFPELMQGEDRLSPLELARQAIVLLSEASFGDYLAQLADWPYEPKPTVPHFYVRNGEIHWKATAAGDDSPRNNGTLDPKFLGAVDFVENIGGEEILFLNQDLIIEEQRRQELQDSEGQPDNKANQRKAKPHRRCDGRDDNWDDSSFDYDSNPEEYMKKRTSSDPSESDSESNGSTAPTSCSKHSSDDTDSDSSTLGSSDSDLIGFNVWQDFGVEEGVEYWGDTTESDSFSSTSNGHDDSPDFEHQDFGGDEQQLIDDDNEEQVKEDINYFGDDEMSGDDEEPPLSPVDHVRSVIELLDDIDTLIDSASEPEETSSPELEQIDIAFAENWYRQVQRVNHGEDDAYDNNSQEPEWLHDQNVEPWDIQSSPPAFMADATAYFNHVDQTISDNYYNAISDSANDDEDEDDPEWLHDQDVKPWDRERESQNTGYLDLVDHAIANGCYNNNDNEGEEYQDDHYDEDDENDDTPEWYNNGGDEPSDDDDDDDDDDTPPPSELDEDEEGDDEPSDDDSSGSENEQQQPNYEGPWLPARQPWPAQHALYSFQSRHEAFLPSASPILMHQQLQPPIQRPTAPTASSPVPALVPVRPALRRGTPFEPASSAPSPDRLASLLGQLTPLSILSNPQASPPVPVSAVGEPSTHHQEQRFQLKGNANFHHTCGGFQRFLQGIWRKRYRPMWNAMIEGTAMKHQRAALACL